MMQEQLREPHRKSAPTIRVLKVAALLIVIGMFIGIILIIAFPKILLPNGEPDRLECPGMKNKSECVRSGCIWKPAQQGPSCFMSDEFGYLIESVISEESEILAELRNKTRRAIFGSSIPRVNFHATFITESIIRFKLSDAESARYEVPVQNDFPLLQSKPEINLQNLKYEIYLASNATGSEFVFAIKRKSDETIIWDTSIGGLLMSDQFLQIATYLPSGNIYGLGENPHPSLRHDLNYNTWPLFSRDHKPSDGQINLYGVQPFYTCLEKSGKSHGVLFLNSNAMEVTLMPAPAISFRTIGGVLDFFVILGETPEEVIQLYTSLIGRPMLPPYWSLGFQLSRYGYNTLDNVIKVVERTRNASIAQDVQFIDIDHMEGNRDFTWDKEHFKGLDQYMKKTKDEYGLRWIIILDPAIEVVPKGYDPYTTGVQENVFIRRGADWDPAMFPPAVRDNNITYGKVWPRNVVGFPDFFTENANRWWIRNIVEHHERIPFDGLWIDMNEPANFGTNEKFPEVCKWQNISKDECWVLRCPRDALEDPPYNPLASSGSDRISKMTLCMGSIQGEAGKFYNHYDVHSLYGWSQTKATLQAAEQSTGTRSLVISRSTYPSSGRYAGHWLGDNESRWKDLHRSIIGILEFNLFGIPYIGADVCGFFGDTTDEMCRRWMQLGAFYTFFRNHNGMGQMEQDPGALSSDVVEASQYAVERRYKLLPYLYTLFYRAHIDGSTVIRPLFHEFPEDEETWANDKQFLWGKSVLVSPVLEQGASSLKMYLPKDEWFIFEYENSRKVKESGYIEMTDLKNIPVHIRSGVILPIQDYKLKDSLREEKRNIILYIFPKESYFFYYKAFGELFVDDGLTKGTVESGKYLLYEFKYENCSLDFIKKNIAVSISPEVILKQVVVFKSKNVNTVKLNGNTPLTFKSNLKHMVLIVDVNRSMLNINSIKWTNEKQECETGD